MVPRHFAPQPPDAAAALAPLIAEATGRGCWSAGDLLRLQPPRGFVLADRGRRAAVALVSLAADEAEILDLGVRPPLRGRGLGRALLQAALCEAAVAGAARVFLEVATDNAAACALYAAAGFAEIGRRPAYYARPPGPACDALVLSRALADPKPPR